MRLYLAGADSAGDHLTLDGLNGLAFLVSYWYILNGRGQDVIDWSIHKDIPLFLDSGAFSAMTLGAKINRNEYIDYCVKHQNLFTVIASLDVIGDHAKTYENHRLALDAGVKSIPTFHVNAPFEHLDLLCRENNYVALGIAGMQKRRTALFRFCAKCHIIARANKTRLHGFALTGYDVLSSFPWYSVDSSTWVNARRFGKVFFMIGKKFVNIGRDEWNKYNVPESLRVPRNCTTEQYAKFMRHNARTILEWTLKNGQRDSP